MAEPRLTRFTAINLAECARILRSGPLAWTLDAASPASLQFAIHFGQQPTDVAHPRRISLNRRLSSLNQRQILLNRCWMSLN